MPLNQLSLDTKLQAILSISPSNLVALNTYIPTLGTTYTISQVQAWIDKRVNLLNDVNTNKYSDAQINTLINNQYNSLNSADKAIADKILANQNFSLSGASSSIAYDKLVSIILYNFLTKP